MVAALASYLDARAHNGQWLIRIEDIDPPREPPGAADDILRTLERTGLAWDDTVIYQSANRDRHEQAIDDLTRRGLTYVCRCSRRSVRETASAAGLASAVYAGACRERAFTAPGAVRILTEDTPITAHDRLQEPLTQRLAHCPGDFVIRRRDELIAYQLAVVVDDHDEGITDIVRGVDLWDNTPRQIWLQQNLGLARPRYMHFPILVNAAGDKLSKQTGAAPVATENPAGLLHRCLALLQQNPPADLAENAPHDILDWAIRHWRPEVLTQQFSLSADSVATQQNPLR